MASGSARITDWLDGSERNPGVSTHFTTIDATEISEQTEELIVDLGRRVMEAKSSQAYLEKYKDQLNWPVLSQRLSAGPVKVRRGDFGEVVAAGWLEDYSGLIIPVKKLRLQINPGQTLPGTDAVAFTVANNKIETIHFLESKLRTTPAFLAEVGVEAYGQLQKDSELSLEILQFVHEQMFNWKHPLLDEFTTYLEEATNSDIDSNEIVIIVDAAIWDEIVLTNLDAEAGELRSCNVHVLQCNELTSLIDNTFNVISAELIPEMET